MKKGKSITFVGIHSRRTDHVALQKEMGEEVLKASYYLEAMEMYREKFKNTIFIFVSDDMEWGRKELLPRVKTGDMYLAGDLTQEPTSNNQAIAMLESAGRDLSLLAACNHTILSYGTYTFWAGFLAGRGKGKRILPHFFPRYQSIRTSKVFYGEKPWKSKLPRLYYGLHF